MQRPRAGPQAPSPPPPTLAMGRVGAPTPAATDCCKRTTDTRFAPTITAAKLLASDDAAPAVRHRNPSEGRPLPQRLWAPPLPPSTHASEHTERDRRALPSKHVASTSGVVSRALTRRRTGRPAPAPEEVHRTRRRCCATSPPPPTPAVASAHTEKRPSTLMAGAAERGCSSNRAPRRQHRCYPLRRRRARST